MESNDVANAAMNEIWGILFSLINTASMAEPVRCKGYGGGGGSGRVGWGGGGGSRWGDLGVTCPQGQALVHHRLPLPPLTLLPTISRLNIGTELVGEGTLDLNGEGHQ